jgi:hypothetical protein
MEDKTMKVKFLTSVDRSKLPALYATENIPESDKVVQVKFFNPYGAATWLAMEFDGNDTFFGAVNLFGGKDDWELGYFSLAELMSVKARIGGRTYPFQGIERDRSFKPMKYSEAKAA